jgi:hypothetical protein
MANRLWGVLGQVDHPLKDLTIDQLRGLLVKKCADFQVIWDTDDGRNQLEVVTTDSDRTIMVVSKNGETETKQVLSSVVKRVLEMWEQMLSSL